MKRFSTIFLFLLIFSFAAFVQNSQAQKGSAIFKIPEGVLPMDWNKSGFKGILMLRKDSPSGIFVAYPNDGEKIEELRERAAKFIAPMFTGPDKEKEKEIKFKTSSIPNHKGDFGDSGFYYSYTDEKTSVQILFYERTANGTHFIYGYFAQKNNSYKDIWADEKGQGVKVFEKFWKTFKEEKEKDDSY